jgi:protein-disulfide isomerase
VKLTLTKNEPVPETCYRELTFEGRTSIKNWSLDLYLSPDQRFLTDQLFDTNLDPLEEERRKSEKLMAGLVQNKGTSKGPDNASVTIVEFSDFECPFCQKFAETMDEVLSADKDKDQVRVVFHHLPLSIHPWSRVAAEGAACAQLQSSDAFWAMHDQFFRHQQEVTPDNIKQKIAMFAKAIKGLDLPSFQTCLDNQMSLGLVLRDMNMASANDVNGTPTLFINGHKVTGVKGAEDLRQLIAEAAKESVPTTTSEKITVVTK